MEREPGIPDLSGCPCRIQELKDPEFPQVFPVTGIERMEKVVVDMIGLEFFELDIKDPVHIFPGLYTPWRQFCGKFHLFPVTSLESPP